VIPYVIPGERGSGTIWLNGLAARRGLVGDRVTVLSYAHITEEEARTWKTSLVPLDDRNRAIR